MNWAWIEILFLFLIILASGCLFGGVTFIVNHRPTIGLWILLSSFVIVLVIMLVPDLSEVAKNLPWRHY